MTPVTPLLALLVALATYRLARLVTIDYLFETFRERVKARFGDDSHPAYLVECPWCLSVWVAPWPSAAAIWWPTNRAVWLVLLALSASALTGLIAARLDNDNE